MMMMADSSGGNVMCGRNDGVFSGMVWRDGVNIMAMVSDVTFGFTGKPYMKSSKLVCLV